MYSKIDVERALCQAIERERSLDSAGIIFAHGRDMSVLRQPMSLADPYIYCNSDYDIRLPVPNPPIGTRWRTQWTPANSRFDVPYNPTKDGDPEITHDFVNLVLDLVVLGIGVSVVLMTGGIGAIGVWEGVQLGASGLLAVNDGARTISDVVDHGEVGRFEDSSKRYGGYFEVANGAALGIQFIDGGALVDAARDMRTVKLSDVEISKLAKIFTPIKDWGDMKDALKESKLTVSDAIKGEIGPGQRVKLGKLLNLGGRKTKIIAIRKLIALKIANDFGASLISIGQSSFGGTISQIFDVIPNFKFSLLFINSNMASKN